jgi:hypothetical protein
MKRLEDLLNIDLPLPARFGGPTRPQSFRGFDVDFGGGDEEEVESDDDNDDSVEAPDAGNADPGMIQFGDHQLEEEPEASNLGDDFFGENAGSTRASGRRKFDEDEEGGGTADEDPDLDEIDDDAEEESGEVDAGDDDLDEDDDFDDDDDGDDDDDDFDDDE